MLKCKHGIHIKQHCEKCSPTLPCPATPYPANKQRAYISPAGVSELECIRVNYKATPTGGAAPIELLARLPSDECGCPEELWRIDGLIILIHFEADGSCEMHTYAGDWESTNHFTGMHTMAELRAEMFKWVSLQIAE